MNRMTTELFDRAMGDAESGRASVEFGDTVNEVYLTWKDGSGTSLKWDGKNWRYPDDGAAYRSAIDTACGY